MRVSKNFTLKEFTKSSTADRLANNLNFGALGKATELRQRLLFTLGALIVFRLGTFLPIPGINPIALQQFFEQQSSGICVLPQVNGLVGSRQAFPPSQLAP